MNVAHKKQPLELGYGDYLRFRDMIMSRSGLYFPEKKRCDLELGVGKALEQSSFDAPESYYHYLNEKTPQAEIEFNRLINLLTIGETHFFRDTPQFNALATQILPSLIDRKRQQARASGGPPQLRLWSAGCASGEEPYSLAVLLNELIPDINDWRILVLGTDINDETLQKARQAVYSDWSFREARAISMRAIYFNREDKRYYLHDKIKQMVTFARHNLIEDGFPAIHNNIIAMDMIICRNVMIYFAAETVQTLVGQFYETLEPSGWLVVGHSEPSLLTYKAFQAQTFSGTLLYQKTGEQTRLPESWRELPAAVKPEPQPPAAVCVANLPPPAAAYAAPLPPRRTGMLPPLSPKPSPAKEDPYHVARQLLSEGNITQAISLLENNLDDLSSDYQPYAHCLLARAYADQGDWGKARQMAAQAIAKNRLLSEPYFVLSMVDDFEGKHDDAIANLKKVIYLEADNMVAHFNLGILYKQKNQLNDARRAFRNTRNLLVDKPTEELIPDSGDTTVGRLLVTLDFLLNGVNQE